MILSLLLSSFLNTAHAVPLQITQQGRLLDANGAALTGTHTLTFRIYDSGAGGSVLWSEPIVVSFNNGYYATVLGADEQNNALDSSTLSLYPLYLELQVDNNAPMTTRQAINSAPYAQMAGNAEIAESVDGGSVNATEVSINASQVIDGNGYWVGQPITVDWNNIDPNTIPSYIADGDDNTQLSEGQVEGYITNDAINLAVNSQMNGSDIVTAGTFNSYLPTDIADGDSDTLAGLSCSAGEIAGWDGNTWVCVSDSNLTLQDITAMLANNQMNLHASTTIGGATIVTTTTDSDTLAALGCADGEVAKYNTSAGAWECGSDIDTDTTLDQTGVLNYVAGQQINLGAGSQVDGNNILTTADVAASDWNTLANRPSDLVDGDDDTLAGLGCSAGELAGWDGNAWVCVSDNTLSVSDITTMVANNAMDLNVATTIGGLDIVTSIDDSDTLASLSCVNDGEIARYDLVLDEWYCDADIDTVLDEATVETYITNGAIDLDANTTIGGSAILTTITDSDTLAALGCSDGQVAKYNAISSSWSCATDVDTDTQLSESEVETYITNGAIDLNSSTTIGGNSILTSADTLTPDWNNLRSIPSDIDDGDDDTLASIGCADGETLSYSSSSGAWVCTSSSSGGSVEVGTYVGDGNSSQLVNVSTSINAFSISNSDLGLSLSGNSQDSFEILDKMTASTIYGNSSDGEFEVAQNATLTGLEFNYESFSILPGRTLTVDSGVNDQGVIIRSVGEVRIDGILSLVPRSTISTVSSGTRLGSSDRNGCYNGTDGSDGLSVTSYYGAVSLTTSTEKMGNAGGLGGSCRSDITGQTGIGGTGGNGGGGITVFSSEKITIGTYGSLIANGDTGALGSSFLQCNCGQGGEGSGGVVRLYAPEIVINGQVITNTPSGISNGVLILIGSVDSENAIQLPSEVNLLSAFSDHSTTRQLVNLVDTTSTTLSVKGLLNQNGQTYTYIVQ